MQALRRRAFTFLVGVASFVFSAGVSADPPSRVARLGYLAGAVSFSPAGENDWIAATINRPLGTGDRLWSDAGARAEIQVGRAMVRMNADTAIAILNLDDRIAQLQLTQGTLNVHVRRLDPDQVFEVDTPNLAFTLRQAGEYRIEVEPNGNATTVIVRKGQGEAYGDGAAYVIDTRQAYRFTGNGLREYQYVAAPRLDEFDHWASGRDSSYDNSNSARYVSQYVVGYQDLDANGTWRNDAAYGNVWVPNRVAADWAPYRDGHWAWVDPWGWTWVDDAPWGFAVSHYGRWANFNGRWGWVPGPVRSRAYYAPALVVFVGGNNFQLASASGNVGGVAWFPLAPREVYRPAYRVSRRYYENINRSNTVINNTIIHNTYNTSNVSNIIYANRMVSGAVVAVPKTVFVQSQPVSSAAVRVSRETMDRAPMAVVPSLVPTEKSVRGAAAQASRPPGHVFERTVIASTAPPAPILGNAAQRQQLTVAPGKSLDDAARKELNAAAPAPSVKVVPQATVPSQTLLPPPAPATRRADAHEKSDERKIPSAPAPSSALGQPAAIKLSATPLPATPPIPVAAPPDQRGNAEQRGRRELPGEQRNEQRRQPWPPSSSPSPSPTPPQGAMQTLAPPPPALQTPATQAPEQGRKSEQRGLSPAPLPAPTQRIAPTPPQFARPPAHPAPQQRMPEPKPVPVPAQRAPPPPLRQRAAPPNVVPSPEVALPASRPARREKPAPAPATKPAEPSPPIAAPKLPQSPSAPNAEPRGDDSKPAESKPLNRKTNRDERKREEENRKQER